MRQPFTYSADQKVQLYFPNSKITHNKLVSMLSKFSKLIFQPSLLYQNPQRLDRSFESSQYQMVLYFLIYNFISFSLSTMEQS